MRTASLVVALIAIGAGLADAQSVSITKPKEVARKAVDATNAHTAAMTASQDSTKRESAASPSGARTAPAGRTSVQTVAGKAEVAPRATIERETFRYDRSGRRDPFVSLMTSGELRPLITELRVTAIAFSPRGNSVAILRDLGTKEQYRVRVGESLGRMRVARINQRSITFTIEEFGFSRQETLNLFDPKKEISQ
jgi:hypothetical protein